MVDNHDIVSKVYNDTIRYGSKNTKAVDRTMKFSDDNASIIMSKNAKPSKGDDLFVEK